MNYAIAYTKVGTTLTFWLNRFSWGGFVWSLVRSRNVEGHLRGDQEWNQPALRFASQADAETFIAEQLAQDQQYRAVLVND